MRAMMSLLTGLGLALLVAGAAAGDTLWKIGRNDGDYREFAIAGNYKEFAAAFPADAAFRLGESKAREAWPFIQPGPADDWAGSKPHTFTVSFSLDAVPDSACRLMLYLCDTQQSAPPAIAIAINGNDCPPIQLAAGTGDASLDNAKAGKPIAESTVFAGDWLRKGDNTIAIATTSGSWMLYDAVALESGVPKAPQIRRLTAQCTPMFRTVDGALKQAVRIEYQNTGMAGAGELRIAGDDESEQAIELGQGLQNYFMLVTPFAREEKMRVVLKAGETSVDAEFDARPEKQWKLFVAASAHTDIGYTDIQEKCMALHVDNTLAAMDAAEKNPSFKWNLEVFAQADWFKELKPDMMATLEKQIQSRNVGLTALYLNMLTGLCSGEEMMWLLRPAQMLGRRLGVPVDMASLNDVPSSVGTMPMFLRHAGIRYMSEAINEDRGPVFMHCDPEMIQSPFWWEAPDGSRILAIFTRTYFQVYQVDMHISLTAMQTKLPGFLERITRPDYPSDAIFINGAFLDNCAMTPNYANVAEEWNKTWDFPKVILATTDEYFRYVEDNFANDLPVYRGDMGVFWEDGAASSALETEMVRWAKAHLSTAEKWKALAGMRDGGAKSGLDDFSAAWKEILYYDEHTWGSAASIGDPNGEQTQGQWARKAAYATRSLEQSKNWGVQGDAALRSLAGASEAGGGNMLIVSNPMSWARDVAVTLPASAQGATVRDTVSGKTVSAQKTAEGGLFFVAQNVPPMGYRVYAVEPAEAAGDALLANAGDDFTWKTAKYQIHINPQNGGLDSIKDLASGKEWVDAASGRALNQFVYVLGGNGTAMIHPNHKPVEDLVEYTHETATVALAENGPARAVLHIARTGANVSPVDTELIFHADGTFDLVNVLHKQETLEKEGGYFAFPFGLRAADEAKAFLELPYGIVEADTEQMPGACREWYSVNTFAATANATASAYVAAPDTPLFTVGDVNRGRWPGYLTGNRNVLYAYVFNNYWHTNYKASQGGDIRCAFSVRLSDAPFDAAFATRFGWGRALDMTPERSGALAVDKTAAAEASFLKLDDGPVVLGELLPFDGYLLARLYNPAKEPARTAIQGISVTEMLRTDLFGENGAPLPANEKVTVPARGIVTLLLKTN